MSLSPCCPCAAYYFTTATCHHHCRLSPLQLTTATRMLSLQCSKASPNTTYALPLKQPPQSVAQTSYLATCLVTSLSPPPPQTSHHSPQTTPPLWPPRSVASALLVARRNPRHCPALHCNPAGPGLVTGSDDRKCGQETSDTVNPAPAAAPGCPGASPARFWKRRCCSSDGRCGWKRMPTPGSQKICNPARPDILKTGNFLFFYLHISAFN